MRGGGATGTVGGVAIGSEGAICTARISFGIHGERRISLGYFGAA